MKQQSTCTHAKSSQAKGTANGMHLLNQISDETT
jgi:hypothetical protein